MKKFFLSKWSKKLPPQKIRKEFLGGEMKAKLL